MICRSIGLLQIALLSGLLAIPNLAVADDVDATVGQPFSLVTKLKGKSVKWRMLDGKATDIIRIDPADLNSIYKFIAVPQVVGKARYEAWSVDGDEPVFESWTVVYNPGATPIPPGPRPDPKPDPRPDPVIPSALVEKLKAALAADIAEKNGDRESARTVAKIFLDSANLLEQINDPAIAPKTPGDYFNKLALASLLSEVPRPPFLGKTRDAVGLFMGGFQAAIPLTEAIKADLVAKSRQVGQALTEAAK